MVAETLVTNFVYCFGLPREVRSDQCYNFDLSLNAGSAATPSTEQDRHHAPA
jgi:hypothetical protein